jgi:hypothetical protein
MALLKKRRGSLRRKKRRLRSYNTIRCPLAGHQVGWCRGLCTPVEEQGLCGRIAPHGLQGRTQRAIASYQSRRAAAEEELPCAEPGGADRGSGRRRG